MGPEQLKFTYVMSVTALSVAILLLAPVNSTFAGSDNKPALKINISFKRHVLGESFQSAKREGVGKCRYWRQPYGLSDESTQALARLKISSNRQQHGDVDCVSRGKETLAGFPALVEYSFLANQLVRISALVVLPDSKIRDNIARWKESTEKAFTVVSAISEKYGPYKNFQLPTGRSGFRNRPHEELYEWIATDGRIAVKYAGLDPRHVTVEYTTSSYKEELARESREQQEIIDALNANTRTKRRNEQRKNNKDI